MRTIKTTTIVSVLALSLSLSACATKTPQDALQEVTLPTHWTASNLSGPANTANSLPLNWLEDLNDPALSELVAEAMNHNNNLGAAAKRVEIARQSAKVSRAGLLPNLGINVGTTKTDLPNATSTKVDTATGQLSWEADVWGGTLDGTRAAYLGAASAKASFDAARLSIAGAVAQGWYTLVATRLQRELAERDVESGKANLSITERRYTRGVSSSLDVRLARSSAATSQATLIARQQAEQEAQRALEVLLGRYPSAELAAAEKLPQIAPITDESGFVIGLGTPQSLLTQRPDLIAASADLTAAGLQARQAQKALLPSFTLNGSISADTISNVFDVDDAVEQLTASLIQPIFQGGALKANAKRSMATAEAAVYDYAQTALTAFTEVENAIAAEEFLAAREEAQRLAFEEAVAAEELTQRQYINGTTNIFNLISAQQRRINAESQYISAAQIRLNNRINLYLAIGGSFAPPTDSGPEKFLTEASGNKPLTEKAKQLPLFRRWWQQGNNNKNSASLPLPPYEAALETSGERS